MINGTANGTKASSAKKYSLTPIQFEEAPHLDDQASMVRSKNAGPYELPVDLLFADDDTYLEVKMCGVLTQATIANLYNIDRTM